ncbi:MAG: hypothetical protein R3C28_25500 [Pirellulaceae bacterium]
MSFNTDTCDSATWFESGTFNGGKDGVALEIRAKKNDLDTV